MTIQEYQEQAKRTFVDLGKDNNYRHVLLGIFTEVGELMDVYKKNLAYGKEIDRINVTEEVSDMFFYIANYYTLEGDVIEDLKDIRIDEVKVEIANPIDILLGLQAGIYHALETNDICNAVYSTYLALGFTPEEFYKGLENNINKLKVRYPENFSNEKALNRDLESERKELEK